MGKHQRIIFILVASVVALVLVVLVGKNVIITLSVPPAVRSLTGFDAEVGHVNVGVFSSQITIRSLKVTNPSDFAEKRMLDAPEIHVEYKLPSMLTNRREFPILRLKIAEVIVVINEKGESNVARILAVKPKSGSRSGDVTGTGNHYGKLELRLGKVTLIDYSKMINGKPLTKETTLNLQSTFHNLNDVDLRNVIMLKTVQFLPAKLGDITPDAIQKELGGVVTGTMGLGTNGTGAALETVKEVGRFIQSKTNSPTKEK